MPIEKFPDPSQATEDGILALGGDLHPDSLSLAYSQGVFPWPVPGLPLAWFCPPERAILEFKDLHIPKSLKRARNQAGTRFRFSIDEDFKGVITRCAKIPRPGQPGTWITPMMLKAYCRFHELGHAHSVEIWEKDGLIGGIYGVDAGGAFAGESMFHLKPNASKLALLYLIEHLQSRGLDWIDIQVMTPHLEALGAKLIDRDDFLERLQRTREKGLSLFPAPSP